MTSEQFHTRDTLRRSAVILGQLALWTCAVGVMLLICSCTREKMPGKIVNPYLNEQVWAVAPFKNESGTTTANGITLADRLTQALDADVYGISTVPVNRVLSTMAERHIDSINNLQQAATLARQMGVDGIILGEISAYDPYDPPVYGVSLLLVQVNRPLGAMASFDPHDLMRMYTDVSLANTGANNGPTSVKLLLNAADGDVRAAVKQYAEGRSDPQTALGWERYIKSMELFTQFASHRLVSELLDRERLRVSRVSAGR